MEKEQINKIVNELSKMNKKFDKLIEALKSSREKLEELHTGSISIEEHNPNNQSEK